MVSPVAVSRHHFGWGPRLPISWPVRTTCGHPKLRRKLRQPAFLASKHTGVDGNRSEPTGSICLFPLLLLGSKSKLRRKLRRVLSQIASQGAAAAAVESRVLRPRPMRTIPSAASAAPEGDSWTPTKTIIIRIEMTPGFGAAQLPTASSTRRDRE